jgi:hypothetical protein
MVLMPGLSVILSFQRSIQVSSRDTSSLTRATILEVTGIIVVLFLMTFFLNAVGAIAATTAYLIGRLAANFYLIKSNQLAIKKLKE